jgi:hypothetical protein
VSADTLRSLLADAGYPAPVAPSHSAEGGRCAPPSRAVPAATERPGQRKPLNAKAVPAVPGVPGAKHESSRENGPAGGPAKDSSARLDVLARMRRLAEAEGIDASPLQRVIADDLGALAEHDDDVCRAYLRALHSRAEREAGRVPAIYTALAVCGGCGPVWLWPGAVRVAACPWCEPRRRGVAVPRPGTVTGPP